MIGQQKNNRTLSSPKLGSNRNTCNLFLKSRCISELSWNFFEKHKCSGIAFSPELQIYVSNGQSCLQTTGLYDDLLLLSSLFHFFYFIFSVYFHLVYVLQFLHLFLMFFFKPLSNVVEKLLYTHIHICKYV